MENTAFKKLYDLLVTRDFEPEILSSEGKEVSNPEEAELFSFDWKTPRQNYGTVVALLGPDQNLEVYFGDNLGRSMEGNDKQDWYDFLAQMKQFAVRNLLKFEVKNLNKLKYTMQGMAAIKEGLFEGYYGTRKVSYSDQPKRTKLVIKHNKTLGEDDVRYRYIENLFVETEGGERFKVPSRSLTHGRMLARHCSEGGTPYDAFGQHINQIVSEIGTLNRFIRATRNKPFAGHTQELIEQALRHYQDLKNKAKKIISRRGYLEERECFDPATTSEREATVDDVRAMFLEQNIDTRIEEALPILAKLTAPEMREADEFESWAKEVTEGTWALPDTLATKHELEALMAKELPVGPDATNATEILYDIFGDDELFNQLEELAQQDPDADARPIIQARLAELGIAIAVPGATNAPAPNPAAADQEPPSREERQTQEAAMPTKAVSNAPLKPLSMDAKPKKYPAIGTLAWEKLPDHTKRMLLKKRGHTNHPLLQKTEDIDTDGIMMTKPSNMSSESIDYDDFIKLVEAVKQT